MCDNISFQNDRSTVFYHTNTTGSCHITEIFAKLRIFFVQNEMLAYYTVYIEYCLYIFKIALFIYSFIIFKIDFVNNFEKTAFFLQF